MAVEFKRLNKAREELNESHKNLLIDIEQQITTVMSGWTGQLFPEYNDHGVAHSLEILRIIEEIFVPNVFKSLKSIEITGLYIAAYIHDMAMHLTKKQFITLINNEDKLNSLIRIKQDEEKSIAKLWEYHLKANGIASNINISIVSDDVIKNFIRDYHSLIAELMLINNKIPSYDSENEWVNFIDEKLFTENESTLQYFAFIAKSHQMDLGKALNILQRNDYLEENRTGIRWILILSMFRLGDLFHLGRFCPALKYFSNASKVTKNHTIAHKICQFQFNKNSSSGVYLDVNADSLEPEIYVLIREWIVNFQTELFICAARINEEYKKNYLKTFWCDSNILYPSVKNGLKFIPEKINFHVDMRVAPLLIEPLYGNNPTYAIRELLQNAVDACREKKMCQDYATKITISIQDDKTFVLEDNGIGMDEHVIINHFFNIGSKYHESKEWLIRNKNEDNQPKYVRIGRFGIGILSAFILGDTIKVETTRYNCKQSYCYTFEANLDLSYQNTVAIKRKIICDNINKSGTRITIKLSEKIYQSLRAQYRQEYEVNNNEPTWYDWMGFINKKENEYLPIVFVPEEWDKNRLRKIDEAFNKNICNLWDSKAHAAYEVESTAVKIIWSWLGISDQYNGRIFINNVQIPALKLFTLFDRTGITSNIHEPTIFISDPMGCVPITLKRDRLSEIPSYFLTIYEKIISMAIFEIVKNYKTVFRTNLISRLDSALVKNHDNPSRMTLRYFDAFFRSGNFGLVIPETLHRFGNGYYVLFLDESEIKKTNDLNEFIDLEDYFFIYTRPRGNALSEFYQTAGMSFIKNVTIRRRGIITRKNNLELFSRSNTFRSETRNEGEFQITITELTGNSGESTIHRLRKYINLLRKYKSATLFYFSIRLFEKEEEGINHLVRDHYQNKDKMLITI